MEDNGDRWYHFVIAGVVIFIGIYSITFGL